MTTAVALAVPLALALPLSVTAGSAAGDPRSERRSDRVADRATGTAPGAPGEVHTWNRGDKDGYGTSRTLRSKTWYTLNNGVMSEVYYPRIDTPSTRDTQLVVSDGATFTDREDEDTVGRIVPLDDESLVFRQVNMDRDGAYKIVKTYVTDPDRDAVVVRMRVVSMTGDPLRVFLLHDPALANDGDDDRAPSTRRHTLVAKDDEAAVAVRVSRGFRSVSSGYQGVSDGWTDLASDHRMSWHYTAPEQGNVVQLGRVRANGVGNQHFTVALGFGPDGREAATTARAALRRGFADARSDYSAGWHRYLGSLDEVPASAADHREEYLTSAMVLAASEDKTYRGGFVAAPGRPWAWANELQDLAVYHAVWSRDQYQIATGLMAAGDMAAARRALEYLWDVQQQPDGSFPQNSRLDGEPVFGGLQMDEVAFPLVMAWQLGQTDAATWRHVRLSADFLVDNGPATEQERWENIGGYSPATIASEIAGLVCAARIARMNGDTERAATYLATADRWERQVEEWTLTSNGPLSDQPYYLRITETGNPNQGTELQISDGGPLVDQRRILDPSFLELVRLGIRPADYPHVLHTLDLVDQRLSYMTPNGRFWHRASFDGYGERRDGTQWEPVDEGSRETLGRGWPLLGGERGEWALLAGKPAQSYLDTMARAADDESRFMAEQVWDHRPPAGTGSEFRPGEPTFAATPLTWTHAQFVRLARSIDAGEPVETPRVVACRYALAGSC
ncbi:MAG: GH15 [uncultured Nocardioidaceae bacterium]|uniref:GH15 n=1 Tax=uncultured Nocardioidaceae bacterium TaxID=253824 RepID=A0A6J4M0Q4_9ACTN|nr:MAG: GH15 [uncultured Nocardioidaceae bacterium]